MEWPSEMVNGEWSAAQRHAPEAARLIAETLGWGARDEYLLVDGAELHCRLDWATRRERRLAVGVCLHDGRRLVGGRQPKSISVSLRRPVEACAREIERRTRPHREWYRQTAATLEQDRQQRRRAVAFLEELGFEVAERVAEDLHAQLRLCEYLGHRRLVVTVQTGEEPSVNLDVEGLSPDQARRVMALIRE